MRRFPKQHRLRRPAEFRRVFDGGKRRQGGPLLIWIRPNQLEHHRLGLAISRRAGNAVVRNRIKRQIREGFRHLHPELPGAYDVIVSARAHPPLAAEAYRAHLREAVETLHRRWNKPATPRGQSS